MSRARVIHIVPFKSTAAIELRSLTNGITGQFENAAIVTVMLKDADGVEVVGETWPLVMSYVSASDGIYRAILTHDLQVTADTDYVAVIEAEDPNGSKLYAEATVHVKLQNR